MPMAAPCSMTASAVAVRFSGRMGLGTPLGKCPSGWWCTLINSNGRCCSSSSITRPAPPLPALDRKSTRLNSSHVRISYAVFCLKKKNTSHGHSQTQIQHHPLGVIVHAQGSTQRSYILVSPYGHVIHHGINSLIRFGHTIDEGHS